MTKSLIQRYTYGNFTELPTFSPEADFFLGGPARQRELLAVARTQVALARETNAALRESAAELSASIARELDRQTEALEGAIQQGADRVVFAIDELGSQISAELGEIRWQLLQLRSTSEQILDVLKRPRSTEAQELLRQGVRNLINDKLGEAEDRFLRALDLDNTDYQVLMNLATIALRKGEAGRARSYFRDAITLPDRLDSTAKAEALWSLARLFYAESDYRNAVHRASESLDLYRRPRRLFQYGVYLMLASDGRQGLTTIEGAIREEPPLFALAALSSDLEASRQEVNKVLAGLLEESSEQLQRERETLSRHLLEVSSLPNIERPLIEVLRDQLRRIDSVADVPAYSELRAVLSYVPGLQRAVAGIRRLSDAEVEYQSAVTRAKGLGEELATIEAALNSGPKTTADLGGNLIAVGFWGFIGLGLIGFLLGLILGAGESGCFYIFVGSFVGALILVGWVSGRQSRRKLLEQQVQEAREQVRLAQVQVGSAASARQGALASAAIPEWPIQDDWARN